MAETMICCYRPKPGKEKDLLEVLREHEQTLRSQGLVTARPSLTLRAKDGSLVEILEWKSKQAVEDAHTNDAVKRMWNRFNEVGDCVSYGALDEAGETYPHFEALER